MEAPFVNLKDLVSRLESSAAELRPFVDADAEVSEKLNDILFAEAYYNIEAALSLLSDPEIAGMVQIVLSGRAALQGNPSVARTPDGDRDPVFAVSL